MTPDKYYLNLSLENIEGEQWKDVVGFEGLYQISDVGRLKSINRNVDRFNSRYSETHQVKRQEQIISPYFNKRRYLVVSLSKNGIVKKFTLHKLVGLNWIENPNNYPTINHKRGVKTDNRASELEWCTHAYNNQHAYDLGLKKGFFTGKFGSEHHRSKPVVQLSKDGLVIKTFTSAGQAERSTGINRCSISAVCAGRLNHAGGYKWIMA